VGHDDERRSEAGVELVDQRQDVLARPRVEVACRLVGEEYWRVTESARAIATR